MMMKIVLRDHLIPSTVGVCCLVQFISTSLEVYLACKGSGYLIKLNQSLLSVQKQNPDM